MPRRTTAWIHWKGLPYSSPPVNLSGLTGLCSQQAIHPLQVAIIQDSYVPSPKGKIFHQVPPFEDGHSLNCRPEILRAAKILHQLKLAHAAERGAVGLEGEMIDAPMLKQVSHYAFIIKFLSSCTW